MENSTWPLYDAGGQFTRHISDISEAAFLNIFLFKVCLEVQNGINPLKSRLGKNTVKATRLS